MTFSQFSKDTGQVRTWILKQDDTGVESSCGTPILKTKNMPPLERGLGERSI